MDPQELAWTALRALGVYALMLVVIRLLGKRTVGNFSAFDLLVALMLGEVVDEIIFGDVSVLQGVVAIVTLAAAQYGNSWLSYSSPRFSRLLEGTPTTVLADGRLVRAGMRQEHLNEQDVMAALRLQGIDDAAEVKRAIVEIDGEVSVVRQDWAEPLTKADLDARGEIRSGQGDDEHPRSRREARSPKKAHSKRRS
jgi:uncharacterized membrane protein YcaP (DUF421 family)